MSDQAFDFNKALTEIQEINRWFQSEDIPLEEGLAKLKRGLELIKKCSERLGDVENEFKEIKKKYGIQGSGEAKTEVSENEEEVDSDKILY